MRRLTSKSAKELARHLADCHRTGHSSPVLWLGAGCSLSAACYTEEGLLTRVSETLGVEVANQADLRRRFSEPHYKLLLDHALRIESSRLGYSLLAQLVARGYFRVIVTSNFDFQFEDQLRVLLPSPHVVVCTRDDQTDEDIARQLANLRPNEVFLLRLHVGLGNEQKSSGKLLEFQEALRDELRRLVRQQGLVFVGYSVAELHLAELLQDTSKSWFVDPFTQPQHISEAVRIGLDRIVTSDDALFDNVFQGLCSSVLGEEASKRLMMGRNGDFSLKRNTIDKIVGGIAARLKADSLDDKDVENLTGKLLEDIRRFAKVRRDRICLLFANDVEAPGGREIRTLIRRVPHLNKLVKQFQVVTANITGRSEVSGIERAVKSIEPELKLDEFEAIIILDDISFSGNTLNILRDYLVKNYKVDPTRIVAALLRIESDLKSRLESEGWFVFAAAAHDGFGLSCPWGFARPTRAKLATEPNKTSGLTWADLNVNCFMPQSSLGFIPKPWGELIVFRDNTVTSSRILYLERGERTSFHYHLLRDEIFFVLDDRIRIGLWDRYIELSKNQSLRIPAGVPHSVIALESACRVLEITEGFCDAQRDIVRLHDIYARPPSSFGDDDGLS